MIPLIVDLETEWRGGQNQALLLLKGLYERGHAAELVAAHDSALGARASSSGICVHHVSRGGLRIAAALKIRQLMANGRIELVHANESHGLTAAWLAGAHKQTPLIFSRRVGYPLKKNPLARARFNAADRIIANSQWVAEQAEASGAAKEKLTVVYEGTEAGLPFSEQQRREARVFWKIPEETPLLGCVGVLLPDKGQEWLIRSLTAIRENFPTAKLLLAGDGPCLERLKKLATELRLEDEVLFAGFVRNVKLVYAALDVFLLPSFFEALNNSLLAAMAYGIPSIAFRLGALGEIIEHEKSGLLVSGPNVEEISGCVQRILGNREFAQQLAEAGRERVQTMFLADRMVDETLRVYREVLQGDRKS